MYLNEKEKNEISKKIENLEKESSAELVAVITKKSDDYRFISSLFIICSIFIVSFISLFLFEITTFQLVQIQLLTFLILYFLFEKFDNLILSFLPKSYKKQKASRNANEQFLNLRLNRTKTNQGIMFFVSIDEKYVEIIADKTISEKISNDYWQDIINEFIKDVKRNKLSLGYLKAINSCSEILTKEFPIQKNDENELSNSVIELG
uniref:TPM domain-containing protein n=1 Tax=Aliarcobacter sp. TaxID=2321116 RepID=UPI0040471BF1